MKKSFVIICLVIFAVIEISAQSTKGMSLNGTTGIIAIPNAKIGWDKSGGIGVDFGYHAIFDDVKTVHIPKVSVSFRQLVEIAAAYDSQEGSGSSDLIFNGKIRLPIDSESNLAFGVNFQNLGMGENIDREYATQIYFSVTYPGTFFKMPAETTLTIGKSFGHFTRNEDIDFGMGFDLLFLPVYFNNYVHWITDFSNFSYSVKAKGTDAFLRGTFNTGFRIDLSQIPTFSKFKFLIDIIGTDLLDSSRTAVIGATFGFSI